MESDEEEFVVIALCWSYKKKNRKLLPKSNKRDNTNNLICRSNENVSRRLCVHLLAVHVILSTPVARLDRVVKVASSRNHVGVTEVN
ncbi:Hypothetical protein CINCED_3A012126 [Cinara cedri]|uniref:Uncharacterized protein n=1 Tax=Cinara cedri TaxID=506608 RepID=A0A5E4NB92_9HEMI|nr:Hypothetical protein CINCED_3A012126 [Cinara cedri]